MSQDKPKSAPSDRVWSFFASVKLSFFLLLALAATSILGTVIPQKEHLQDYVQAYGESGARVVMGLGLNDMYHAPWFLLLLALLGVNLVVCSLNRLPDTLKIIRKDPQDDLKRAAAAQESFTLAGEFSAHLEQARGLLQKAIGPALQAQQSKQEAGVALFAQKGAWSRLSVYVVHLSVLIIFAGAIIGNIRGFSGRVNITEGDTVDAIMLDNGQPLALGFQLRVDKFTVSYYEGGMPSEYRSDVTFLHNGKEAVKAALMVNDPAEFQGIDFYQSSYGQSAKRITVDVVRGDKSERAVLSHGQWNELPGGGQALILDAREDVHMGDMYHGPAARIGYEDPEGNRVALTAFKVGSKMPARGPLRMEIVDLEVAPYTGLQVKYDPGVWFIWVGCTLMVVGFLLTFYTAHRKVWIRLTPAGKGRTRWELAGSTNKNRVGLRRLLERMAAQVQGLKQGE